MATRRKRKSTKRRTTKRKSRCKIVTVCGKRRRICWGKKGITSNNPVGKGTKKRKPAKRKASATTKKRKSTTVLVSKARATTKAGKIRKGCRKQGTRYRCPKRVLR